MANGTCLLLDNERSLSPFARLSLGNGFETSLQDKTFNTAIVDVQLSYLGCMAEKTVAYSEGENSTRKMASDASTLVLTVVLETGDLLIYHRHPQPNLLYEQNVGMQRLPLAFVRVEHTIITRPPKPVDINGTKLKQKGIII